MTKRRYASSGREVILALALAIGIWPMVVRDHGEYERYVAAHPPPPPPNRLIKMGFSDKGDEVTLYEGPDGNAPAGPSIPNCTGVVLLESTATWNNAHIEVVRSPPGGSAPIGRRGWLSSRLLAPLDSQCP